MPPKKKRKPSVKIGDDDDDDDSNNNVHAERKVKPKIESSLEKTIKKSHTQLIFKNNLKTRNDSSSSSNSRKFIKKKVKDIPSLPEKKEQKQENLDHSLYIDLQKMEDGEADRSQQYTRKQSLNSVLLLKELKQLFEDMVQSAAVWSQDGYKLMDLYTHQRLDSGRHVKLGDCEVLGAFQLVSGKQSKFRHLNATHKTYVKIFPPLPTPLKRSDAVNQVMVYEKDQFITSAKTSMVTQFHKRQTRWIKLQLYRYWLDVDRKDEFPKGTVIYDYVKEITKASYLASDVTELKVSKNKAFNAHCVTLANRMRHYLQEWMANADSHEKKDEAEFEVKKTDEERKKERRKQEKRIAGARRYKERGKRNEEKEGKEEKKLTKEAEAKEEKKKKTTKKKGEKKEKSLFPVYNSIIESEWTRYLPWMRYVLEDIASWHKEVLVRFANNTDKRHAMLKGFKLFALLPRPRLGIRHVAIDNRVLHKLLKSIGHPNVPKEEKNFMKERQRWWDVAFKRLPGPRLTSTGVTARKGRYPRCFARTDGVSFSRCYYYPGTLAPEKKKKFGKTQLPSDESDVKFMRPKVPFGTQKTAIVIGLDPGKRDVFSTSVGHGARRENRRCTRMSNAEYYALSGATKRHKRALRLQCKIAHTTGLKFPRRTAALEKMTTTGAPLQDFKKRFQKHKKKRKPKKIKKRKRRKRRGKHKDRKSNSASSSSSSSSREEKKTEKKILSVSLEEKTEKKEKVHHQRIVFTHKVTSATELIERHFFSTAYNFRLVWDLVKRKTDRRSRLDTYIRSNKAIDVGCKRILDPWTTHMRELNQGKTDKAKQRVVIAFGQARFNGTKGCASAPTKRLYHRHQKVHKNRCVVVDTDEFRTSQICSTCGTQMPPVVDKKSQLIYSLKACPTCFTVHDRDANAAHNIAGICERMLFANGIPPVQFRHGQPVLEKLKPVPRDDYSSPRSTVSSPVSQVIPLTLWSTTTT